MEKNNRDRIILLIPIIFCLILTGCAHYSLNANYMGPKPLPESIKKEFSYTKNNVTYNVRLLEENHNYAIKQIDFKSSKSVFHGDHDIVIHYYDIQGNDKRPVIMVLPILGGSSKITKDFASYFSDHW